MKRTGLKKYEYADVEYFTSKAGLRFRKIMNKSWHIFLKLGTTRKIHIVDYPQLQKGKNYIFEVTTQYMKEQYVEIGEKRWGLLRTEDAHGKYEKYQQMKTLVELGQDNNNISTTLVEMLGVLAEI